jgi:predicted metalloprotease
MDWEGRRKSDNVEDQRNTEYSGSGNSGGGGMLNLLPMAVKFLGVKGTAVLAVCIGIYALLTGNIGSVLSILGFQQPAQQTSTSQPLQQTAAEKKEVDFVSVILADTEETWRVLLKQKGKEYEEPHLVLFRNAVQSACGFAQSATGPFYCPADRKVYLDLAFFDDLQHRFNAPGDFAQAYVIAHEVGHHVQTLLGISAKVHAARKQLSKKESNQLLVRQELQADCFAGVWAYHADKKRKLLEAGDIEEGLAAASAVGDDTLQKQAQGYVVPDSFTHGSAAQRMQWFKIGLQSGDMDRCNTFAK